MLKKLFFTLMLTLVTHSFAWAQQIECSILGEPQSSSLLIEYRNGLPSALSLKSPNAESYRTLDLTIAPVSIGKGIDAFSAQPLTKTDIDWAQEAWCFKEVGTQWYFVLDFEKKSYGVYLSPHIITENNRCIPPRFTPQAKELDCQVFN